MQPALPIPTDNIYKFACIFGLVLIVTSVFSFATSYSWSLDRKIRHYEATLLLEAKEQRTKAEDEVLAMHKKLIELTRSNEKSANNSLLFVLVLGIALSFYGAWKWYSLIQLRDDELMTLQLRKLKIEVEIMEADTKSTDDG